jgi:hypothetical protein
MATIVHPTPITESQAAYAELAKLLTPQTKAAIKPFLFISFFLDKNRKHETLTATITEWPPKWFLTLSEAGRAATSVHGFVLAVFRARARARSIMRLYHSILFNALLRREFSNGGNE